MSKLEVGRLYENRLNKMLVVKIIGITNEKNYVKFVRTIGDTSERGLFMDDFHMQYVRSSVNELLKGSGTTEPKGELTKVKVNIPMSNVPGVSDTELNNKYSRGILGFCGTIVKVNVYRVLDSFNVTNPQLQHLVKKALCVGQRGHKSTIQDYKDILDSAQSAYDLALQKEKANGNSTSD